MTTWTPTTERVTSVVEQSAVEQSAVEHSSSRVGPALVEYGADLEVGERRGFPSVVHCGTGRLGESNKRQWGLADEPDGETTATGVGGEMPSPSTNHYPLTH